VAFVEGPFDGAVKVNGGALVADGDISAGNGSTVNRV
jgi:hypothetical protein